MRVFTVATHDSEGLQKLISTCPKIEVLGMGTQWNGFGNKLKLFREAIEGLTDTVMFVDAYDVLFLNSLDVIENNYNYYFKDKIVFNGEKNCWPLPELSKNYFSTHKRRFLNSGAYMGNAVDICKFLDKFDGNKGIDDQLFWTLQYFDNMNKIVIDVNCRIFLAYSFLEDGEFNITPQGITVVDSGYTPQVIHGNGRTDMSAVPVAWSAHIISKLDHLISVWADNVAMHQWLHEYFYFKLSGELLDLRVFVEQNIFGFGERSFYLMWKLLIDELRPDFNFLEIGVFKGQIIAMMRMLAPDAQIVGVTELSSIGLSWESDYDQDIKDLHDRYDLEHPIIIQGNSTNPRTVEITQLAGPYDIVYIDGGHDYATAMSDLVNYGAMLKTGGYLVVDDCCNDMQIPWGIFPGIQEVTDALNDYLTQHSEYKFLFSLVHIKVYQKI